MISVTVTFGRIQAQSSQPYLKGIAFNTVAGQNNYTVADVADLELIEGGELFEVKMDGSNLINGSSVLATWNDTTFAINSDVTVSGGERITIIVI